jgi:hypothetical protein
MAAAALAILVGGGAAIAASGDSGPSPKSFFDAVAKHLGISPQKLQDATKAAALDQVDAALKAGKITQAEANELKARINSGDYPPFFGPLGPGLGFHHRFHDGPPLFGEKLSAAADYLGLSEAQLRARLNNGQTLAQIAKAQNKSVDGLKQALLDDAKQKLDQLVKDGELTQAQADAMLARLQDHIDDLVNRGIFRFHFRGHDKDDPGPRNGAFWVPVI